MDGPPSPKSALLSWTQSNESVQILETICAYIDNNKDLVNLAGSFKAISSIALDALWRSMAAFYPLLHILVHAGVLSSVSCSIGDQFPETLVAKPCLAQISTNTSSQIFTRNPSHAVWERFAQYTNRIETIHLGEQDRKGATIRQLSLDAHGSTLMKIGQVVARTPYTFKRLRSVEISGDDVSTIEKVFSYAPLLVSPALTRITVVMEEDGLLGTRTGKPVIELAQFFLSMVVDGNCPVTYLDIWHPRIPSFCAAFETISQLQKISELHLGTISCTDQDSVLWLSHIGSLPTLQRLTVDIEPLDRGFNPQSTNTNATFVPETALDNDNVAGGSTSLPGPPERRQDSLFPLLQCCRISGSSPTLRHGLSLISSKVLVEVSLGVRERSTADLKATHQLPCLDILESKVNIQKSLESLNLSISPIMIEVASNGPPLCPASFLKPIQHLKCLKGLRVTTPIENLTKFVHDVVINLRELEDLQVPMHATHNINIRSLHLLATSCSQLQRLVVPIRTLPGTIPPLPVTVPISNHGLRELHTNEKKSWNSMTEHLLAARHINALFPSLEVLEGGDHEGWGAVWTIVQMIRDVTRRQAQ